MNGECEMDEYGFEKNSKLDNPILDWR
jgi:hypothetical protein